MGQKQAILFLHGWPGSFLEYLDVARLLNGSANGNYDLIVPSLPGYGYSDSPVRPGMNTGQIARIMHNLMRRLGYTTYLVCGGDWGASIGTFMAQLYPTHVKGLMITMVIPKLTLKHTIQLALGHLFGTSIVLDNDEKEFLDNHFNILDHLKFLWCVRFDEKCTRDNGIPFVIFLVGWKQAIFIFKQPNRIPLVML